MPSRVIWIRIFSPGTSKAKPAASWTAAVHTGFGISRLAAGGSVPSHVHSYEESLYVIDGEVVLYTSEAAVLLGPGEDRKSVV